MVEPRMVAAVSRLLFPPLLCWLLLLLLLTTALVAASFDFVVKPEFGEKASELNVTVFAGQTSRLPCTVKHLSGKRVSWIRRRDLQVLSTGRVTFSTDLRISVLPGTTKFRVPRHARPSHARGSPLPNAAPQGVQHDGGRPIRRKEYSHVGPIRSREYSHVGPIGSWESFLGFWREGPLGASQVVTNDISSEGVSVNINAPREPAPGNYSPRQAPPLLRRDRPRRAHRNKKSLNALSKPQQSGRASYDLHDQPSGKYYIEGGTEIENPIAIYPQGPASGGVDSKSLQPGPNYIEGVWEPEDYTLQIKFTRPEDAGTYMCQINTEPKVSQEVQLSVVKMRAEIVGRRELFVKAGTPVTLACRVNEGPLMPGFILWYKGERLVEYDRSGGRIQVLTGAEGVSHLLLQDATPSDSANYTCSPSGGEPASLILNVIVDERQAAMQQGNSAPPSPALLLPAAAAAVLTALLSCFASNESLAVGGVAWLAWAGPTTAHLCTATAVLATAVALSLVPPSGALTRDSGASPDLAPCHVALGATLCAVVFLLCHSPRLEN